MRRGIWDAVVSAFENTCDVAKVNLRNRPILSFAMIGLMLMIVIALPAILLYGLDERIFYLILLPVMVFVIIISIISIKSSSPKSDVGKITIVDPKKDESIWAGFEGLYYAFNAPFELEKDYTQQKKLNTYKIHRERYRDKKFEARYLYFTGKNRGERKLFEQWITNFKKFFDEIETAKLGDNLKLYIVKDEKIPDYTFFVGKKNGKDCSIMYPFRRKYGSPTEVFLVYDREFAKTLIGIFEGAMDRAKAQRSEIKTMEELSRVIM